MHETTPTPRLALSPTSGVPLYRQLMDAVRAEIAAGRIGVGRLLPSVRTVAKDLEINPMTVSKAYSQLEAEGTVERVRGQGMRVVAITPTGAPEDLLPEARRLVTRAYQLGLTREQVLELLSPLLEEIHRG